MYCQHFEISLIERSIGRRRCTFTDTLFAAGASSPVGSLINKDRTRVAVFPMHCMEKVLVVILPAVIGRY